MKKYEDRSAFFSYGVGALVIYNNKVLLIKKRSSGRWLIPSGLVQSGDSLLKTLKRELREESGIIINGTHVKVEGIIAVRHRHNSKAGNNIWIVFLVKATSLPLLSIKDTEEIKKVQFFNIDNLLKKATKADEITKIILRKYQKNKTLFSGRYQGLASQGDAFYHLFL